MSTRRLAWLTPRRERTQRRWRPWRRPFRWILCLRCPTGTAVACIKIWGTSATPSRTTNTLWRSIRATKLLSSRFRTPGLRSPTGIDVRRLRIGVNALYLIPEGVGGTEIYLRNLLGSLGEIDGFNEYFLFTNRETSAKLGPKQPNFYICQQPVRAAFRPARIVWEQIGLPLAVAAQRIDVLLNPGFTAPIICGCPQVTVFHDLQHKRHPEHFRRFDLPFWRFFLFWSAQLSEIVIADSAATAADLETFYRLPSRKTRTIPLGVDPAFFALARARRPEPILLAVST